jgi:hypothetical protein
MDVSYTHWCQKDEINKNQTYTCVLICLQSSKGTSRETKKIGQLPLPLQVQYLQSHMKLQVIFTNNKYSKHLRPVQGFLSEKHDQYCFILKATFLIRHYSSRI